MIGKLINPADLDLLSLYAEYIASSEPMRAIAIRQDLQRADPSIENAVLLGKLATEVAVIAFADQEDNVQIKAFLRWAEEEPPSLVTLKRFCAENMPAHLIPDQFSFVKAIPKASTDKIDYQSLVQAIEHDRGMRRWTTS